MDTLTELARRSVEGIKSQGELAYEESSSSCLLRTSTGNRCAVGQLIAPEHYDNDLELWAAPSQSHSLELRIAIRKSNPDLPIDAYNEELEYWKMLTLLQDIHDNSNSVAEFVDGTTYELENSFGVTL